MIFKARYALVVLACTLIVGLSTSYAQDGMMTGWHSIYAPVANLEHFANAEMVIANKAAEAENITVVLYGLHGKKLHEVPMQMRPSETKRLSVAGLVDRNGRQDVEAVEVLYYGMDMDVVAQISLKNEGNTGSVDVPMFEDMEFMSNGREAVWWEPSGSRSTIIVGNSGDTELNVQLSRSLDKQLHLKAHETQVIEVIQDETQPSIQAVRLTSDGMPGQLRAAGFVRGREWDNLQTIRYIDPASSTSGQLFANGVPFDGRDYHLSVVNTSDQPEDISGMMFGGASGQNLTAPVARLHLNPGESGATRVELPGVKHPGWKGSALMLASTNGRASFTAAFVAEVIPGVYESVPFKDLGTQETSTGGYPWRLDGDYESRIYVSNMRNKKATYIAQIIIPGQPHYSLGRRTILPHATDIYDLRKMRDDRTPDESGHVLPKHAIDGQFIWGIESHTTDDAGLIGRNEVTSLRENTVASLSCPSCTCGYGMSYIYNDGPPASMTLHATSRVNTFGQETSPCSQNNAYRITVTPAWAFDTPNVLNASSGQPSTITASNNGRTQWTVSAPGQTVTFVNTSCQTTSQNDTASGFTTVGGGTIPTSDAITNQEFSYALYPSNSQTVCAFSSPYGWDRLVDKIAKDQNGVNITSANNPVTEVVTVPAPNAFNIPAQNVVTGSGRTATGGTYQDHYFLCTTNAYCPSGSGTLTATQHITYGLNGSSYQLNSNYIAYRCSGITVNGN